MSENKTITQLALDAGVETGGTENALAILKFAKSYADQEKRSTAIAFHIWVDKNNVPLYSGLTIEEMYDLFNSL